MLLLFLLILLLLLLLLLFVLWLLVLLVLSLYSIIVKGQTRSLAEGGRELRGAQEYALESRLRAVYTRLDDIILCYDLVYHIIS